jgi:YHS domain-containing protein
MKKIIFVACMAVSFGIAACHSASDKEEQQTVFQAGPPKDTVKKDFSHVVFATKKDTSCGMPLSAGIEDTLQFDGKVYGFCSKECKDAFVAVLKKEKKL